jgi:hypothetical protein
MNPAWHPTFVTGSFFALFVTIWRISFFHGRCDFRNLPRRRPENLFVFMYLLSLFLAAMSATMNDGTDGFFVVHLNSISCFEMRRRADWGRTLRRKPQIRNDDSHASLKCSDDDGDQNDGQHDEKGGGSGRRNRQHGQL